MSMKVKELAELLIALPANAGDKEIMIQTPDGEQFDIMPSIESDDGVFWIEGQEL